MPLSTPMLRFVRHYLLAVQFFTRVAVTGRLAEWVGFSPALLRASTAHWPGVGWLVGAAVALCTWTLLAVLPPGPLAPLVAAALGTVWSVLMTGALHEDGLADVADGLGGSLSRARALEIMKDSRVGAFGAMAVMLALMCKVALLALLGSAGGAELMVTAVFAGHVVSRTWPLITMRYLPYVGDPLHSKAKPLAGAVSSGALAVAGVWCALALALVQQVSHGLSAWGWMLAVGTSCASWVWMHRWFARRLQGYTGDCLGAAQQVGEVAFYAGLACAWGPLLSGLRG